MLTDRMRLAGAVATGPLAGVSSFLLGRLVGVAAVTGVSVAVVVVLTLRHPDTLVAPDVPAFAVGRWSGIATAFVAVGVVTLPLALRERLAVGLLLASVAYAAWLFGVAYARAKSE